MDLQNVNDERKGMYFSKSPLFFKKVFKVKNKGSI
jgi:hypothetical protein